MRPKTPGRRRPCWLQLRYNEHGAHGVARTRDLLLTMQVHFLLCYESIGVEDGT